MAPYSSITLIGNVLKRVHSNVNLAALLARIDVQQSLDYASQKLALYYLI